MSGLRPRTLTAQLETVEERAMMTFVEELRHALHHEPVLDSALQQHPKVVDPVDNVGEEVRVLTLEESVPVFVEIMRDREVFQGLVWEEIWYTRARHGDGTAMEKPVEEEVQVRAHLNRKCPNPEQAAVWVAYRDGKPAHARAFDRPPEAPSTAWVQWIVGVKAVGVPSLRVAQCLYDVGVRTICWKALPEHPLHLHWARYPLFKRVKPPAQDGWVGNKLYKGGLLNGHYVEYAFEMRERPQRVEDYRQ